ncbi:MAG: hypothetical protein KGV46_03360, partial [Pasteurella sp.]|nr:hypothetical protein [Pasteurella sp.]
MKPGDQVSVGSYGYERQIKNVAPGVIAPWSTDAINGSQLSIFAGALQGRLNDLQNKAEHPLTFTGNTNKDDDAITWKVEKIEKEALGEAKIEKTKDGKEYKYDAIVRKDSDGKWYEQK